MIEVRDLVKRYGRHLAVDHLSFTVPDGQIFGFLGPNGAGKSTTMNLMTGYLGPTEGEILVDGHSVTQEPEKAKQAIGYLPEQPPLYLDMTAEEYLEFAARLKKVPKGDRGEQTARVMELTGITGVRGRLLRNLSKGYRQRVGIAQALLGNPRYIILDEPTVGLDPLQIIEIRDLIRQLGQKHTVILSSHILSEVQAICESVLIIAHGKLVAFDTPQNLERRLAENNRLTITAECGEEQLRAILDGTEAVASYTVDAVPQPALPAAPAEKAEAPAEDAETAPAAAEPAAEAEVPTESEPSAEIPPEDGETTLAAPDELPGAALAAEPEAPAVCQATLTLAGDPAAACRAVFFAFAGAGCALLQMTPIKADLENIFIELTEDEPSGKEATAHESGV